MGPTRWWRRWTVFRVGPRRAGCVRLRRRVPGRHPGPSLTTLQTTSRPGGTGLEPGASCHNVAPGSGGETLGTLETRGTLGTAPTVLCRPRLSGGLCRVVARGLLSFGHPDSEGDVRALAMGLKTAPSASTMRAFVDSIAPVVHQLQLTWPVSVLRKLASDLTFFVARRDVASAPPSRPPWCRI